MAMMTISTTIDTILLVLLLLKFILLPSLILFSLLLLLILINFYLRFYITGDNGICYSQPFVLNVEGEEIPPVEVPETHDISTFLRGFATVTDWLFFRFNPIIWLFKYVALGYNVFERFFHPY